MPHLAKIHVFARLETGSGLKADVIQVPVSEAFIAPGVGGSLRTVTPSLCSGSAPAEGAGSSDSTIPYALPPGCLAGLIFPTSPRFSSFLGTTEMLAEAVQEVPPYLPPT